jgi:DHA1 family multidrug resistance protein-like MFS transporter
MIWAPISELDFIGRSPVYAATFVAFLCFSILAATAKTWNALLVLRFLQAFFGSPCLAIGGASMHDLFADLTLPYPLAIWIAAAYCGPALGSLIASYVVPEKGWRWGLWEVVWLAAPTLVLVLLLPETFGPTIKARSQKMQPVARYKTLRPTQRSRRAEFQAIVQALQDAIVKPVQITIQDPAVAVANLYTSFMYGTYYTFFDAIPRVYPVNYSFTTGQLGLAFLCIIIACVVGGSAYGIYIKCVFNVKVRQGRLGSHEEHLRPALVACFLPPIGLFLFGWTSDGAIHWAVSLLGVTLYAIGIYIILQCLSVYLPRIYPSYAASLFAANDLCRSLVATACVHAGAPLYDNLGIGPGVSVLGALSVLGIPGMWFIYYKGPALRARSRFVE